MLGTSGSASAAITSNGPGGSASSNCAISASIVGRIAAMARGVNARLTMVRRVACCGSSEFPRMVAMPSGTAARRAATT